MSSKTFLLIAACAGLTAASPAVAAETPEPAFSDSTIEAEMLVPATVDVPLTAIGPIAASDEPDALDDAELSTLRGGEALLVSNQTLVAITSGNVINGNYTAGNVSLSDHALSSFNGVGNILINTGGQVSLQTGMNLTINVGE